MYEFTVPVPHTCDALPCRVAEEPLIRAIQGTGSRCSREEAVSCLQKWFLSSLHTNGSMESTQPLEGVSIDTRLEGLSQEESTAWADDRLVIQWIMKFTDGGQEGNSFQKELDVSECTCSCTDSYIFKGT